MVTVFAPIIERLTTSDHDVSRIVGQTVADTLTLPASGTLRAWMQAHHGGKVTTIQIDQNNGSAWAPMGRTVDASRASSVKLDGSTRDYAGMRVKHTAPNCIIVADDWHAIAYIAD